jgi:hypothetical protein
VGTIRAGLDQDGISALDEIHLLDENLKKQRAC